MCVLWVRLCRQIFKNNVSCVGVVNLAKNEKNRQQKSEKNNQKE